MRKKAMSFLLGCIALPLMAQVAPLEGFYYGSMPAPTGWEWQSVDSLSLNKDRSAESRCGPAGNSRCI